MSSFTLTELCIILPDFYIFSLTFVFSELKLELGDSFNVMSLRKKIEGGD